VASINVGERTTDPWEATGKLSHITKFAES
jgi:hypothetical protein